MISRTWLVAAALAAAVPAGAQAPNPDSATHAPSPYPRGKVSGYLFGDVYWNVDGDPRHVYGSAGQDSLGKVNIDPPGTNITRDLNGVQVRRIYFQLDNDLSKRFASRFRLEMDGRALTSDGKIGAYVKNAYLQAKEVVPRGDFYFGMVNTPSWENSEEFWAYRSIEKTIADLHGLGSASDLGIALKGSVDPDKHVGYSALIGNGRFQRPEDNRYKRFYLAVPLRVADFRVEPYADWEDGANGTDRATYKVFAGWEARGLALGAEFMDRVNHKPAGNDEPVGFSVFGRWAAPRSVTLFGRFDLWQPNRRSDNRVDQQLWIAGLDWQPIKDVHVMPNIEALQFVRQGTGVVPGHNDLQARLTFYYRYSGPQ